MLIHVVHRTTVMVIHASNRDEIMAFSCQSAVLYRQLLTHAESLSTYIFPSFGLKNPFRIRKFYFLLFEKLYATSDFIIFLILIRHTVEDLWVSGSYFPCTNANFPRCICNAHYFFMRPNRPVYQIPLLDHIRISFMIEVGIIARSPHKSPVPSMAPVNPH